MQTTTELDRWAVETVARAIDLGHSDEPKWASLDWRQQCSRARIEARRIVRRIQLESDHPRSVANQVFTWVREHLE